MIAHCPDTGKVVYATPQAAWRAADAIGQRQRSGVASGVTRKGTRRGSARGYQCRFCQLWHVTSDVAGRKGKR